MAEKTRSPRDPNPWYRGSKRFGDLGRHAPPGDELENTRDHERIWHEMALVKGRGVTEVPAGAPYHIKVARDDAGFPTGDGIFIWAVPDELHGMEILKVEAYVTTVSSSGQVIVQLRNRRTGADILSTRVFIDASKEDSSLSTPRSVVNAANAGVLENDKIAIDVDGIGVGARGLGVMVTFDSDPGGSGAIGPPGPQGIQGIPGAAGGYGIVEDEGSGLTQRSTLNFVGSGVNVADVGGKTQVNIGGGSAGALVLLDQKVAAASATLDFVGFMSSLYDEYLFELIGIAPSAALGLQMRFSTDGGSTYDATATSYITSHLAWSSSGTAVSGGTQGAFALYPLWGRLMTVNASFLTSGWVRLYSPAASLYKTLIGSFVGPDSVTTGAQRMDGTWVYNQTTPVNAVRFLTSAGNIASGIIRVYGVLK